MAATLQEAVPAIEEAAEETPAPASDPAAAAPTSLPDAPAADEAAAPAPAPAPPAPAPAASAPPAAPPAPPPPRSAPASSAPAEPAPAPQGSGVASYEIPDSPFVARRVLLLTGLAGAAVVVLAGVSWHVVRARR